MFKLKRPCNNCPFVKEAGQKFQLGEERVREIADSVAFQCHKTVDYSEDEQKAGDKPQQCAGLMSVLHKSGKSNAIMQIAESFGEFDPEALDHSQTHDSIEDAVLDHS